MKHAPVVVTVTVVVAALFGAALFGGACAHMYGKDDLDVSVFQHNVNLRWGRLDNAALTVKPEMRGPFVAAWTARMQQLEIQDIEVGGVALSKDGDAADVSVAVTFVDKASMTVRTETVGEHWIRTDDGWLIDKPAQL